MLGALIDRYSWAIDLEICVMPQEGLTNNPGTDELMMASLKNGATDLHLWDPGHATAAPTFPSRRRGCPEDHLPGSACLGLRDIAPNRRNQRLRSV
jgi:hypothetical protein